MRREETYHLLHADAWLRRLADGNADGRRRLVEALVALWADAQDIFTPLHGDADLVGSGLLPTPMETLHGEWATAVRPTLEPLTGPLPPAAPGPDGRTRRTDDFAWLHGELTSVARSEEAATW
jgi:ring-1,2-phenylacetyl-CoA epoxidase subunit PaaC